jgi:class 3 adenylate cyclase
VSGRIDRPALVGSGSHREVGILIMAEKPTKRTSWKQLGKTSEFQIKGLIRRLKVANGMAPADDLRDWLKAVSGDWIPPTSKNIIFADLKRFRDLSPSRHVDFHRMLERIYSWSTHMAGGRPLFANTWGDAIHAIYDSAPQAAAFSLAIVDAAAAVNWQYYGLSTDTNFRVGIHHGPVQMHKDKILGRNLFVGASVIQAARIEPAAKPGQILTSRVFADILNASKDARFECKFIGEKYLSKTEKICPAFGLFRKDSA